MTVHENKLGSYQVKQDTIISAKELEEWHLTAIPNSNFDKGYS